ncbi:MAG: DUF4174 domain-containing protein [Bacteroidota bacterium]
MRRFFCFFMGMKHAFPFLLLTFCTTLSAQDWDTYRWKNRLIILVAAEESSTLLKEQHEAFKKNPEALTERDLLLFEVNSSAQTLSKFSLKPNFEGVLLVGKDGGLKFQSPFPVDPKTIFDRIDSMPMRQAEMRKHR